MTAKNLRNTARRGTGTTFFDDPPYKGTEGYGGRKFDHERFYNWLRRAPFPVFVSECQMPADFVCIGSKNKQVSFSAKTTNSVTERIFLHERWAAEKK